MAWAGPSDGGTIAASASDPSRTVLPGDSSGGLGPLPKSDPGWPTRPQVAPGPQAHEQLLKPPYAPDQAREGELLKTDLTSASSVQVIQALCAEACKNVAEATARELHKGDPIAASMAVTDALQSTRS